MLRFYVLFFGVASSWYVVYDGANASALAFADGAVMDDCAWSSTAASLTGQTSSASPIRRARLCTIATCQGCHPRVRKRRSEPAEPSAFAIVYLVASAIGASTAACEADARQSSRVS